MNNTPKLIHVLLIEDDEIDIQSVQRSLSKANLPVKLFVAHDGVEALELLHGGKSTKKLSPIPELIILDINMPKMNGIEFLNKLRADPQLNKINVLILTTSNSQQDKVAALNLNVSGYITKPMQIDSFIHYFKILLDENDDQ